MASGWSSAPSASTRLVASLASWTLGWSNGLIPSTQPAVAIANSAKKKIRPRSCGPVDLAHDDRVAGLAQRRDLGVGRLVGRVAVAQVQEGAVVAVDAGVADRLVGDRQDALALLARRLRDELLDPQPEGLQRRVDDVGQLVAACLGQLAPREPEPQPARHVARLEALAVLLGDAGGVQHARHVGAHERRGHEPEERQRAVAPADVGVVEEGAPEAVLGRQLLQAGARVGDGDERLPIRAAATRSA